MRSLEERIRPPVTPDPRPRDVAGALLVIFLTMILIRTRPIHPERYFTDVVGQMFSFYLLPALGFCLVLRQGGIDLSVWAIGALGGVLGVEVFQAGGGPGVALTTAAASGAALGLMHGLLIGRARLPSVLVTFLSGSAIVLVLRGIYGASEVLVPSEAFAGWLNFFPEIRAEDGTTIPLSWRVYLRVLLAAGTYLSVAFVVLVLSTARLSGRARQNRRAGLLWSFCASGALAGLGGGIWLVDQGSAPIPRWFLGDLRIPAAAILAGALFFSGRRRTLLVMLCLPATVLAATKWRLRVIDLPVGGHSLQLLLLIAMTVVAHLATGWAIAKRRVGLALPATSAALTLGGILLLGGASGFDAHEPRRLMNAAGLCAWIVGAALLVVSRMLAQKHPVAQETDRAEGA